MSNPPSSSDLTPDPVRAAERLRLLEELADIGMELARELPRQARESGPSNEARPGAGEIAMAYSRIARAVRLTLALETRLAEARVEAAAPVNPWDEPFDFDRGFTAVRVHLQKQAVAKAVEEVIGAEIDPAREAERIERLRGDLYERLNDHEDDKAFELMPVFDLVERICHDLGAPFDPNLWRHADWEPGRRRDDAGPPAPRPYRAAGSSFTNADEWLRAPRTWPPP